jgi:hypothetical protein
VGARPPCAGLGPGLLRAAVPGRRPGLLRAQQAQCPPIPGLGAKQAYSDEQWAASSLVAGRPQQPLQAPLQQLAFFWLGAGSAGDLKLNIKNRSNQLQSGSGGERASAGLQVEAKICILFSRGRQL